jgi:sialic acid synthase SpsE
MTAFARTAGLKDIGHRIALGRKWEGPDMSLFLTSDEVKELTGRVRRDAQVAALRFMGIDHKKRPDGSLAVLRSHVDKLLGGETEKKPEKAREPNWDAINA